MLPDPDTQTRSLLHALLAAQRGLADCDARLDALADLPGDGTSLDLEYARLLVRRSSWRAVIAQLHHELDAVGVLFDTAIDAIAKHEDVRRDADTRR